MMSGVSNPEGEDRLLEERWVGLGERVKKRRDVELELTQLDVRDRGGLGTTALRALENGRKTSMSTRMRRKMEAILGWKPEAIDHWLDEGIEPELADKPQAVPLMPRISTGKGPALTFANKGTPTPETLLGLAIVTKRAVDLAGDAVAGNTTAEEVLAGTQDVLEVVHDLLGQVLGVDGNAAGQAIATLTLLADQEFLARIVNK